jgi:hypothetical protein
MLYSRSYWSSSLHCSYLILRIVSEACYYLNPVALMMSPRPIYTRTTRVLLLLWNKKKTMQSIIHILYILLNLLCNLVSENNWLFFSIISQCFGYMRPQHKVTLNESFPNWCPCFMPARNSYICNFNQWNHVSQWSLIYWLSDTKNCLIRWYFLLQVYLLQPIVPVQFPHEIFEISIFIFHQITINEIWLNSKERSIILKIFEQTI